MKLSHINMFNTLLALFLLLLLNVQILTNLPIFSFGYLFISLLGIIVSLLGINKEDSFYSYLGVSLHSILIISCLVMVLFGIRINYHP
ncbi:hypothetical protein ETC04_08985 [Geobacillus sp. MR]|nr:hypothetical protein [Geobacillus sp. MR]